MSRRQGEKMPTQGQLVREWARERGYEVGIRGRIAPAIWQAYADEHEGFEREVPTDTFTTCAPCGRRWTGLRECHCRECHEHFSHVDNFDGHKIGSRCINPADARVKGNSLREKDTVWGPIWVRDGEHYRVETPGALFD